MEKWMQKKSHAILASMVAMVLWGSAIPMIKRTYEILNLVPGDTGAKIFIAGIRFFLAGVLGFFYYRLSKGEKEEKTKWGFILGLALVQTSLQYIFYYIGLSNTQGVKGAIIQSSNAFILVVLSILFIADEEISRKKVLALVVGSLGIFISNYSGNQDFSFRLEGEGFVLLATIFNAMASVLVRKYGRRQDPLFLSSVQFLLGALPLIFLGLKTQTHPLVWNPLAILLICYGAFISATAYGLWTFVLKYHSSSEFSIYKLFIPIFGSLLSVVFLREVLTYRLVLGLALVLLGSLILNKA